MAFPIIICLFLLNSYWTWTFRIKIPLQPFEHIWIRPIPNILYFIWLSSFFIQIWNCMSKSLFSNSLSSQPFICKPKYNCPYMNCIVVIYFTVRNSFIFKKCFTYNIFCNGTYTCYSNFYIVFSWLAVFSVLVIAFVIDFLL